MIGNKEVDFVEMGRLFGDGGGREGVRGKETRRGPRYNKYIYQFSTMNTFIIYCKHILI